MERLRNEQSRERFTAANREIADFLKKVEGLARGQDSIDEADLQSLSERLETLAPEVKDIPLQDTDGMPLPAVVAEYVNNLRQLKQALETVRCVMLARKVQLENAKRHLHGLQGWVNAYQQTT